jgi:SAM-dependent methyltransferase
MPGTSFDRVASIYDATRGGEPRGEVFAGALAPWVIGPTVVELGVGTGVIAKGLRRHDIHPIGFDLSEAMLRAAVERIGARAAIADVDRLPLPDDCADTAFFVWVLQLVDDPVATLTEAARIVRPGGRVIAILSNSEYDADDEISTILAALAPLRAERLGRNQIAAADLPGLSLLEQTVTPWDGFQSTVADEIDHIERRIYSSLFDVDGATWTRVVVPVLEELRALADPERPRERRNRHPLLVWTITSRV